MLKATKGNQVTVHYRGHLADGTEFDNSYNRETPIEFQVGSGQMLGGFDSAVVGMSVGDKKSITLLPNEAYGEINPDAKTVIPRAAFPETIELTEGLPVPLATPDGQQVLGSIRTLNEETVTVDLNHPLAGQELQFDIELVSIGDENPDETETTTEP
jgi:peptidylprolyl isomerase